MERSHRQLSIDLPQASLIGFAIITFIVLIGYIIGRADLLGQHGRFVLSRVFFFVLGPCLLFTVQADADVHILFSTMLLVSLGAAITSFALFAGVALLLWRRAIPEAVIGSLASGYVNASNIGIPMAVYVLGDPALAAPVVLLQLLVFAPIALTILDIRATGHVSIRRILTQPLRSPIIIASAAGVLLSVTQVTLPAPVIEPFRVIGAAAIPIVILSFGISLHGQKVLSPGSGRRDVLLASAIKLAVMPVVAWLLGYYVVQLSAEHLFAVVVLAGLPTAQTVFNFAQHYQRGEVVARDTVLITTLGSIPVLVGVAALLR